MRPTFRSEDWAHYRRVNERFAEAVRSEVNSDDPIALVQDYHFALVPALIRIRLPAATVIMFWHIPWPNSERVGICPWRQEILEGLLGSSILGFHTQLHYNNFLDSVWILWIVTSKPASIGNKTAWSCAAIALW